MRILALLAAIVAFASTAVAEVGAGFYTHPLHGGGTAFTAHITFEESESDPGVLDVSITVDGHTTKTTATAGSNGGIAKMDAVSVKGGHEIKVPDGKSKPRSKRDGNAGWKVMKKKVPASARTNSADPPELEHFASGTDAEEGIGSLPSTAAGDARKEDDPDDWEASAPAAEMG